MKQFTITEVSPYVRRVTLANPPVNLAGANMCRPIMLLRAVDAPWRRSREPLAAVPEDAGL
jgi:hypothetical protein